MPCASSAANSSVDGRSRRRLKRARGRGQARYRYSYDMLGEAARTAADAKRYCDAYAHAIRAIAARQGRAGADAFSAPGISVKLSALHPRFVDAQRARVMSELVPRLVALAAEAKSTGLSLTVDAEEADRLELTLDVFEARGESEPRLPAGTGSGSRCRPIRSARLRSWAGSPRWRARRGGAFPCGSSRAPIGTPRSSAPRSAGLPIIPCSRSRPRPTCRIWPASRRCSPSPRSSIRNSPRTTRIRWPPC